MAAADPLAYVSSTRAFAYLSERGEDALQAVKDALGSGSSKYLDADPGTIRKQLESTNDVDRLEGLKYVVAMITKGRDPTPYLASVFKLASTTSLEVRKLVYIVVLRYARQHPDLALLSINSVQRDLTEPNPLIRGMALRTLSGMQVPAARSIVDLAVAKAVRDTHPYVRRVAAYALIRGCQAEAGSEETACEHVTTLLRDRSPQVLGPAVTAFSELCPTQWDLLHRHFRKLCYALADMDEWSQPTCVDVLVRYARLHLPAPQDDRLAIDADLELLLHHVEGLLSSTNAAVVMAAVRAVLLLGPSQRHKPAIVALVRLMGESPDVAYVATLRILALSDAHRPLLVLRMPAFYVRADDPEHLALAKLRVLLHLVQQDSARALADELVVYTQATSPAVALDSVTALGQVACRFDACASHCLKLLIGVAQDVCIAEPVASRAVQVAKMLMAIPQVTSDRVVVRIVAQFALRLFVPLALAGRAPDAPKPPILLEPSSRAAALWMLGQYCSAVLVPASDTAPGATLCELLVPDMLRCLVAHWHKEHASVQCQALTLSAKAIVVLPETSAGTAVRNALQVLHYALLSLGMQSTDADVRDRARFYSGLTRRFGEDDGAAPAVDSAVAEFLEQHQRLDRLRLPGVRLRRTQVRHILFAQGSVDAASMAQQLALETPEYRFDAVPTLHDQHFLRGWAAAQVPSWREASELPPAIVRMPEAESARPDLANVRSISSGPVKPAVDAPPPPAERVVLTPTETRAPARPAAWNARFANLDTFFEDDDEEETVDHSFGGAAPEDEEYALDSDASNSADSD